MVSGLCPVYKPPTGVCCSVPTTLQTEQLLRVNSRLWNFPGGAVAAGRVSTLRMAGSGDCSRTQVGMCGQAGEQARQTHGRRPRAPVPPR